MSGQVLIIDDDERLARMLCDYLGAAGLKVQTRSTGAAGLASADDCDVVVLDLGLPDMDGLEVCRRLRERSAVPILMLTARGEDTDRIVGLELGADDYLGKPFNPRELLARLRVILRRGSEGAGPSILRFGRLEIDPGSRAVRLDGAPRAVTSAQFDLLLVLARNAGRVLSRERLMDLARGSDLEAFDRSIDVHISRLRAVLEDEPAKPRRIITVRGAGYVFARAQD
jgi:DNA-binding response OmpR family regulator